ncbi:MAG: FAD-dependent oxidoreductase [Candidatus Lokiarchaeota archaeon]
MIIFIIRYKSSIKIRSKRITFLIVGAGISGLHLGALLSQYGQVIIFEKSHKVGGRARVENIQGFNLDFGIHPIRFGPNSALGDSLKELGCNIEFIKPGKSWVYMRNGKKTSSAIQVNPFPERSSTGELLKNIKRVLEKGSIYYPNGGWNSILNGLINKIKENRGEIRQKALVSEIIIENNKAIGVRVNNQTIFGEFIISTIPVQNLFSILDENLCEPNFVSKCKNLRQTAGISIDFGLSRKISDIDGMIFFEKFLGFGLIYKEFRKVILSHFPKIDNYLLFERPLFLEMIDGVEINTEQHQFKRPGNNIIGLKNLFITGDSVGGEGSGGDVGHTSVRDCYFKILTKIK